MPPRPERIRELFDAACALPAAEQAAFLQARCGDDEALRAEVARLLRSDSDPRLLGEGRLDLVRQRLGAAEPPPPDRIGPFAILGVLGRGGMGIVYRAEQDQPRRQVALKVLAPGMTGPQAHARFALEAEALGRLQHPGIAQVFAAGSAPSPLGEQHWLAMELVAGLPLHAWATARPRTLATRVLLLAQICEAVHHAHQKGLIHRDLKPGNVMVDASDQPKVLDFGIARLIDDERSQTLQTRTGEVLGTLAYMSPEQASGDGTGVDTRTDVYSLGAIAYELLAGEPPLDLRGGSLTANLRRIAEDEPQPLGERNRELRGDLQTIVAMALRKEPQRRYASAQELALDLRRHLAHEPIHARPATATYVLRRFARRHRGLVAGLLLALVTLIAGTATSVAWAMRADAAQTRALEEARVANQITEMLRSLFSGANPELAGGREVSARELFAAGRRMLAREQAGAPAAAARVALILGEVLVGLGDDAGADTYMQQALAGLQAAFPGDDPRVVDALHTRAWALARAQRHAEATPLFDAALAMHRRLGPPSPVTVAKCLEGLASAAARAGDHDRALDLLAEARPLREAAGDPLRLSLHWQNVANTHMLARQYESADEAYGRAEAALPATGAEAFAAILAGNRGNLQQIQRRLPDAEQSFRRALALAETCFGSESPRLITALCHVGAICGQTDRLAEAEQLLRRAVTLGGDETKSSDRGLASAFGNLGLVCALQDQLADAILFWERGLAMDRRLRPGSQSHRKSLADLAAARQQNGDAEGARALRDELEALGPGK
ncbi:MAG: tetratricopeptide repeat protein [Planctomycetes bacterium]|nr:tetratricopeptide repeat protein [Planctomycetota bacterium]